MNLILDTLQESGPITHKYLDCNKDKNGDREASIELRRTVNGSGKKAFNSTREWPRIIVTIPLDAECTVKRTEALILEVQATLNRYGFKLAPET